MSKERTTVNSNSEGFGTAPVFITAICTILGAILFLRFGYAVGTVGFWGVLIILIIGHLVTIPTALSLSEIATNRKVEGGGEYFIISRSFGLNIGATIGLALYVSQAISVAFYVIAFTEAFEPLFAWFQGYYGWELPRQAISVPVMLILSVLIVLKGANLGMKALYVVAAILFVSLGLFFAGSSEFNLSESYRSVSMSMKGTSRFFLVFAIIFPAFTGMTAGVGLSGNLRNPRKAIPLGTISATLLGLIVYVLIIWKLHYFASPEELLGKQLVMADIAWGGAIIIPLGLAASTISSALGSVMVAPRTLQALAVDHAFPFKGVNRFLSKNDINKEPVNASLVTVIIAMGFVILGDVNFVAQIISMFFMVTYGALNLISFLNHFGADPSYRPTFRSRWYISLVGFLMSVWLMFKMNTPYAILSILAILAIYFTVEHYHANRKGMATLMRNAFFQLNRRLQVFVQRSRKPVMYDSWRPSVVCISMDTFERERAMEVVSWISYKYGFGSYIHLLPGYFSREMASDSRIAQRELIRRARRVPNLVYLDTMVSPSYTSALAQVIQLPGIAGMENNTYLFEFDKRKPEMLKAIQENFNMVKAGDFDILILGTLGLPVNFVGGIHVWIQTADVENANLMILLSFIISGHPSWRNKPIKIFDICEPGQKQNEREKLTELLKTGRLPIAPQNVEIMTRDEHTQLRKLITEKSKAAGLTIVGFNANQIKHSGELFDGYDGIGDILFVNSRRAKDIE